MRPIHVWRSRTPEGVWCAHFPSVITTIMDHKVHAVVETVELKGTVSQKSWRDEGTG
jgi:hypothetical protein